MRRIIATLAAICYSLTIFAQVSPSPDENTLALWNFDSDVDNIVYDSGPYDIQGIAVESYVVPFPAGNFSNSRFMKDQRSYISFGLLEQGSPLDLLSLNEWTIEFNLFVYGRGDDDRNIFDNGQIKIELSRMRLSASISNGGSGSFGIMTENGIPFNEPTQIAVVYKDSLLKIMINGETWAQSQIPVQKKKEKKSFYNNPILLGGTPRAAITHFKVGKNHACLATDNGDLQCWGQNEFGQIGDSTFGTPSSVPVNIVGLKNASAFSLGEFFTCALSDGKTFCWGINDENNTGVPGAIIINTNPMEVPGVDGALAIDSGLAHTCAIMGDKTVKCWGRNSQGQLGLGFISEDAFPTTVPGLTDVKEISLGGDHSCALSETNEIYCWGRNNKGQLASELTVEFSPVPLHVSQASGAQRISAGLEHSCAMMSANEIKCWGANQAGQLGNNSTTDSYIPQNVLNISEDTIWDIDSGLGNHSCIVVNNGVMKCWGENDSSQIGRSNSETFYPIPTDMEFLSELVENLEVGAKTNCFQDNTNPVNCFGSNVFGIFGSGDPTDISMYPQIVLSMRQGQVPGNIDDVHISNIARFSFHTPKLFLISPTDPINEELPLLSFSVQSDLDINTDFMEIKLNNESVNGLIYEDGSLHGVLDVPFSFGENVLEIKIKDIQGNIGVQSFLFLYSPHLNPAKPVNISGKGTLNCYLDGNGYVWCWGNNQYGQLGVENVRYSSSPIKNPYLKNIKKIAVGASAICAMDFLDNVWCWGGNLAGELGIDRNDIFSSSIPYRLSFEKTVEKVVAGESTFCALHSDQTVSCWGDNPFNILGSPESPFKPTLYPGLDSVREIALGMYNACFVKHDNTAYCIGHNSAGQIGDGTTQDREVLTQVQNLTNIKNIKLGVRSACAITFDNQAYCWGANVSSQIGGGEGYTEYVNSVPKLVTVTSDAKDIFVGETTTCSLDSNDHLSCWGLNSHGEAGNGTYDSIPNGNTITNFNFMEVSLYNNSICGLTYSQDILCWGGNAIGQGGQPDLGNLNLPFLVQPHQQVLRTFSNLTAGQANTCMKINGINHCWGNNEQGQMGYNNFNFYEAYPAKVTGLENAVETSIGFGIICHLMPDTRVYCAGQNNVGQAGKNPEEITQVRIAQAIPDFENILQVQAGLSSVCALRNDGTVWCWGDNSLGQLGNGTYTSTHLPQQVTDLGDVVEIALSTTSSHACARKIDSSIWCWGRNSNGQLGNITVTNSNVPVLVEGFLEARALSLGANFTCILNGSQKIVCIGANSSGQLGIGNNDDNIDYREVTLPNVLKISSGENHVCAIDSGKNVFCWGANNEGQLGNKTYLNSKYPVKVLSKVDELASGANHTCVLTETNKLGCWGFNGNAQFGTGNTFSRNEPTFSDVAKK